jgi:hypothetical protein
VQWSEIIEGRSERNPDAIDACVPESPHEVVPSRAYDEDLSGSYDPVELQYRRSEYVGPLPILVVASPLSKKTHDWTVVIQVEPAPSSGTIL